MGDFHSVEAQQLRLSQYCKEHEETPHAPTLPSPEALRAAEATLPDASSASYLAQTAADEVVRHITADLIPALNGQGRSSRYFGFVTGGVLPVAEWADNVVSHFDQNVQVHLPSQTIATAVEDAALGMLAALLGLGLDGTQQQFHGRIFTTGATSSNILGLASGREAILARKLGASGGGGGDSVGELGTLGACVKAGVEEIQVLTSAGHSSLSKAASVVGLGRASVKELRKSDAEPWRLDLDAVEEYLKKPRIASIIAVSAGEVNTGRYALTGLEEMQTLRKLADKYGAWIHVDGGMGLKNANIAKRSLIANVEHQHLASSPERSQRLRSSRPFVSVQLASN
jgi:glutamate/tyrosine decarboxylase-like PLP-dependent enzyme